jgi:hypothetical protein
MSKILPSDIACPACGHVWNAILFESVNATRLLHVPDQILDGSFELQRCERCGVSFQPEHQMLYSDLPRRLWVVMLPPSDPTPLEQAEDEVSRVFLESFSSAPTILREHLRGVRPRMVYGHRQLAECLRVERAGIPAPLVECAKLLAMRSALQEVMALGPLDFVFEGIVHEGQDARFLARSKAEGRDVGQVHVPMSALYELAEQEDDYKARYPALFQRPYVNLGRMLG